MPEEIVLTLWRDFRAVLEILRDGQQRLAPGQPLQSFTKPATATIRPEGFGLWIFE